MSKTRVLLNTLNRQPLTNADVMYILDLIFDLKPDQTFYDNTNLLLRNATLAPNPNECIFRSEFQRVVFSAKTENHFLLHPQEITEKSFFKKLKSFLLEHWRLIKNEPELHYHYYPIFQINRICSELALLCAKGLNEPCYSLLYPELKSPHVAETFTIVVDENRMPDLPLVCTHFVLSDCGQYVIEVDACLDHARKDGVLRHSQKEETVEVPDADDPSITKKVIIRVPLSETEIQRVLSNRYAANFYGAIKAWLRCKHDQPSIGGLIATLITGMTDGGAHRQSLKHLTGEEDNAGLQANEVIHYFVRTIEALPEATRNALYTMRDSNTTFADHMNDISSEHHASEVRASLAKLSANTRTFYDESLKLERLKPNEQTDEMKAAVRAAKECLTKAELIQLEAFKVLASTPGKCVELSARGWQAFLRENHDKLYSMTLEHSEGREEQLAILARRMDECQDDLKDYLQQLEEYFKAPKLHENFTPDCNKKSSEEIYSDYLYQWITTGSQDEILNKMRRLIKITGKRPQVLFEIDLFSRLSDEMLALMVERFGELFLAPVLGAICKDDFFNVDDKDILHNLINKCYSEPVACGFFPNIPAANSHKKHIPQVIARIVRLLFAKRDFKPSAKDGSNALYYAASTCMVELIKVLMSKGVSDDEKACAIRAGLGRKHIDCIKALLPTVTKYDLSILRAACKTEIETICQLIHDKFLELGVSGEELAEAMFDYANANCNYHALSFALKKGARKSINIANFCGETPLIRFHSVDNVNAEHVIQLLIAAGADVEYVNPLNGRSVLTYAMEMVWGHCLDSTANMAYHAPLSHAEYRQTMERGLRIARKILVCLLANKLPANIIHDEIENNTLAWLLQNLSLTSFLRGIEAHAGKWHIFSNMLYLADLMTDEQLRSLMQQYEAPISDVILAKTKTSQEKDTSKQQKLTKILFDAFTDTKNDLRYPLIFLLMHHPKIKPDETPELLNYFIIHEPSLVDRALTLPGIDINGCGDNMMTPLLNVLSFKRPFALLKTLINRGANLRCESAASRNLFHFVYASETDVLLYLLGDEFKEHPTQSVAECRAFKRELLCDVTPWGDSALNTLLRCRPDNNFNDIDKIIELLVNIIGQDVLFAEAMKARSLLVIKKLMKTAYLTRATLALLRDSYLRTIAMFLCKQLSANKKHFTPAKLEALWSELLHISLAHDDEILLQAVMENREHILNVLKCDDLGMRLLMRHTASGKPEMVKALLPYVDEAAKNEKDGKTAFDYACERLAKDYVHFGSRKNPFRPYTLFCAASKPDVISGYDLKSSLIIMLHFSALTLDATTRRTLTEKIESLKTDSIDAMDLYETIPSLLIQGLPLEQFKKFIASVAKEDPAFEDFIQVFAKNISLMTPEQATWFTTTYRKELKDEERKYLSKM